MAVVGPRSHTCCSPSGGNGDRSSAIGRSARLVTLAAPRTGTLYTEVRAQTIKGAVYGRAGWVCVSVRKSREPEVSEREGERKRLKKKKKQEQICDRPTTQGRRLQEKGRNEAGLTACLVEREAGATGGRRERVTSPHRPSLAGYKEAWKQRKREGLPVLRLEEHLRERQSNESVMPK